MDRLFEKLSASEQEAYRAGQESVLNEFLAESADLEASRNADTSYGKGQIYILRELVKRVCGV